MAEEQQPLIRVIGFEETYEKKAKLDEFGDKIFDEKGAPVLELQPEDWVIYAPSHSPIATQTKERVRHIIPLDEMRGDKSGEKGRFMRARWSQIEPAYNAWKSGNEIPLDGTPIGQWATLTPAQVEAFKRVSIRTVEEIRDMTDTQCDRVAIPNVRNVRKSAAAFLDGADKAEIAARELKRDDEISQLKDQLAAAMELLEEKATPQEPVAEDEAEEISLLRSELDKRGIAYHHLNKADTLRELLENEAA